MGNCCSSLSDPSESEKEPRSINPDLVNGPNTTAEASVRTNQNPTLQNKNQSLSNSKEAAARAAQERYDAQQARLKQSHAKLKGRM